MSPAVLAVGAHPDDVEMGCGGSIASHVKRGDRVRVVYVTRGEKGGNPKVRVVESQRACRILGVSDVVFGEFKDANIPSDHTIIDYLEETEHRFKADIIYTHSTNELHQDHRTVGYLSLAAFRNTPRILSYESPRVTRNFAPSYFTDITDYVDLKWKALKAHASQRKKRYMAYTSVINLASFRGSQVGVRAAEGFEVIKYLS